MREDRNSITDAIAKTLLRFGDVVLEISRENIISKIWKRNELLSIETYQKTHQVNDNVLDELVHFSKENIERAFNTGKDVNLELNLNEKNTLNDSYSIKIINNHPDKDFLFLTIEKPQIDIPKNFQKHTSLNEYILDKLSYLENRIFFSTLFEHLEYGILGLNENAEIVFTNKKFLEIYQDENSLNLIGMNLWDRVEFCKVYYKNPEAYANRLKEIFNKKEKVLDEEITLADGRVFQRDYIPFYIDGKLKGEIFQYRNISKQKDVELSLEIQKEFYEKILHSIPADIAIFGADHSYLFVNKNGIKNEELRKWIVGKTDKDYAILRNKPDSFYKQRFAWYEQAEKQKTAVTNIEKLINKHGAEEHHLRILHPIFKNTGEFDFIVAYGLNITELIQTQEALKASMETFASAFNNSGLGMALLNAEGKFIEVNDAICTLSGYTREELQNLTHKDITYYEDANIDDDKIDKLFNKKINTYTIEKRYVSKDKRIVLIHLTASVVWNQDGTPRFFIAQVNDITRRKQLEDDLKRENLKLQLTSSDLMNKIKQIEELNKIIAHNLRGPAKNIEMLVNILSEKLLKKDYSDNSEINDTFTLEETLSLISNSTTSLNESLDTLLEILQIKLNKEIPFDECNIETIAKDISKQLHSVIFEKNAKIKYDLNITKIAYPKVYLESILYNLISNALKYSASDNTPEIIISTYSKDNKTIVSVKDNGLGIDMAKYGKKIFLLNQTFHHGFDSKGIGLFITKTQVESLGGNISVTSNINEGSEFTVTI